MARYAHIDVLDGGLNAIAAATKMLLIKNYTALDSYATVTGNKVCEVTLVSGDFSKSGADGAPRVLNMNINLKSGTATGSSIVSDDLHIAFTDGVSKVLLVTDETTNQVITSGNTVNFPQLSFTSNQPSAS
jgi:hypothetical protein